MSPNGTLHRVVDQLELAADRAGQSVIDSTPLVLPWKEFSA